jgi:putative ABC transport system permease protein
MFGTYLYRELSNRRKQTTIIAAGMALAIALVMIVSGVTAGVRDAHRACSPQSMVSEPTLP